MARPLGSHHAIVGANSFFLPFYLLFIYYLLFSSPSSGAWTNLIPFESSILPNPCYPSPCENGGTCVSYNFQPSCTCPSGFGGDYCQDGECSLGSASALSLHNFNFKYFFPSLLKIITMVAPLRNPLAHLHTTLAIVVTLPTAVPFPFLFLSFRFSFFFSFNSFLSHFFREQHTGRTCP